MVESLRTRVSRVIHGGAPEPMQGVDPSTPPTHQTQTADEALQACDEVRHELGRSTVERHSTLQQQAALSREHQALSSQIELALAEHREDLARIAIVRQLDIENLQPQIDAKLSGLTRQERELQGLLAALLNPMQAAPSGNPATSPEEQLAELDAWVREHQVAQRLNRLKEERA
jgi:phage shock protein A